MTLNFIAYWLLIGAFIIVPTAIISADKNTKLTKEELFKNSSISIAEIGWFIIGLIAWPITEYQLIRKIFKNVNKT